jgi:hypothetical protein
MTIDMEALEEIVASSETNSTSTGNSWVFFVFIRQYKSVH